jgi:hypothetical protein
MSKADWIVFGLCWSLPAALWFLKEWRDKHDL